MYAFLLQLLVTIRFDISLQSALIVYYLHKLLSHCWQPLSKEKKEIIMYPNQPYPVQGGGANPRHPQQTTYNASSAQHQPFVPYSIAAGLIG